MVKDIVRLTHTKNGADKNSKVYGDKEYRKVLKELGFEKPEDEPLTAQELRQIYIHMQEDLFVGS